MTIRDSNSLPKGKYSNVFIVDASSSKLFPGKRSLLVINSYLVTFSDTTA